MVNLMGEPYAALTKRHFRLSYTVTTCKTRGQKSICAVQIKSNKNSDQYNVKQQKHQGF